MSLYQKIKIKIRNRWNDFHFKKMFLLIIFIMSIVSCYLPILIISTIPTLLPYIFIEKSWIAYLFLPIPILSIIFGALGGVVGLILGIICVSRDKNGPYAKYGYIGIGLSSVFMLLNIATSILNIVNH